MKEKKVINAEEFTCEAPLRFLDRCKSCGKAGKCKELGLLISILRNIKILSYEKKE